MLSVKIKIIIGVILLVIAGFLVLQNSSKTSEEIEIRRNSKEFSSSELSKSNKILDARNIHHRKNPAKGTNLLTLCAQWKALSKEEITGEELLEKQKSFAQEAVSKLGAGQEMLEFLNFLTMEHAEVVRDWVIKVGAANLFVGPSGESAREWVITIEERQLRESLCELVGQTFDGSDLRDYLSKFGTDHHGQSSVLTGFCESLAKNDPEGAIKAFKDYRPTGVDMSGLAKVMASLPATTNFPKLAAMLPGDSKSLAKNARTNLLAKWAENNPQEAAEYVINNRTVSDLSQVGNVVGVWAATSPDAAYKWISKLAPGEHRDEGMLSIIRRYGSIKPAFAWQYVNEIENNDKRLNIATVILNEWVKTDRQSALDAWLLLYPKD